VLKIVSIWELLLMISSSVLHILSHVEQQESPAVAYKPARRESMPKLLQFDVHTRTTLSVTILVYLPSFRCWSVRNLWNPAKFSENSNLWSSRSSILVPIESAYVLSY